MTTHFMITRQLGRLSGAILLLGSAPARADGMTVPAGVMLCSTIEAAAAPTHGGCYLARGGQRVEIIASLPHFTQLRIWSTNGAETVTAWATRADGDRMQRGKP